MAEVEVDIETGQVDLVRVICANDVGRAINPQQIEGQIEGAVVEAYRAAFSETFVVMVLIMSLSFIATRFMRDPSR